MCGINGVLYFDKQRKVDESQLSVARDTLIYRGPDYGANFIDGNVGLGHRRLSIIDLSADGNQPMTTADQRYTIVFNGEIYNYKELKHELIAKGITFKSSSDTEVLLYMYMFYGEDMLNELNGMFAFAIWDKQDRTLFISRDRVGIKPLSYFTDKDCFVFASEPKSLFRFGHQLEIDEDGFNEMLLYRFVAGEGTIFKGIKKLLPGHCITIKENKKVSIRRWWNLGEKIQTHATIHNPLEWFKETFNSSIRNHMLSDVPVGVLLSGGLDSSVICASLHEQEYGMIQTFNVGFKNYINDESEVAGKLSAHFDMPFHSILVEDDELAENISIANYMLDKPMVHQNEPQLVAISRYAKKHVGVLLSGEGADEFFGGYVRYKPVEYLKNRKLIHSALALLPSAFKSDRLMKLERYFSIDGIDNMLLMNSVNNYPKDFLKLQTNVSNVNIKYRLSILEEAKKVYPNNYRRQVMYLDQLTYLNSLNDRNDRTTMAASIECRVPFLDHRLLEGAGTLPDNWLFKGKKAKYIVKEAYKNSLPSSTLDFRKVGFSVPWMELILKSKKMRYHWEHMEESDIFKIGLLKFIDVKKLRQHPIKEIGSEILLRQFFFMSLWWKQYSEHFSKNQLIK